LSVALSSIKTRFNINGLAIFFRYVRPNIHHQSLIRRIDHEK